MQLLRLHLKGIVDAPTTGRAEEKAERLLADARDNTWPQAPTGCHLVSIHGGSICIIDEGTILFIEQRQISKFFTCRELTVKHSAYMTAYLHIRRPLVYT